MSVIIDGSVQGIAVFGLTTHPPSGLLRIGRGMGGYIFFTDFPFSLAESPASCRKADYIQRNVASEAVERRP